MVTYILMIVFFVLAGVLFFAAEQLYKRGHREAAFWCGCLSAGSLTTILLSLGGI